MSNKNEYLDSSSEIFQDAKFLKQLSLQIKPLNKVIPTMTELKMSIDNLKGYSEMPDDLHDEYANSKYINDLFEYYDYLEGRYNMVNKK
jgi:hypothetical protein